MNKPTFIITAGPTREFIDPIRYLSNPSTGKMGYHIAKAAINEDYPVIYIAGPVDKLYTHVEGALQNISVISTEDMLQAVLSNLQSNTVLIMSAAPADYTPLKKFNMKIKKKENPSLQLVPTSDILGNVKNYVADHQLNNVSSIGFAAETNDLHQNAIKKLKEKQLEMIFLNDVTKKNMGFASNTNEITIIKKDLSTKKLNMATKEKIAYKIIHEVETSCLAL